MPCPYLTRPPPHCRSTLACICDNPVFIDLAGVCVVENCSEMDAETVQAYWEAACS
ncbi:hypothetical protein BGY98DRAFT_948473 [Russula aff. rugulosa BPL654]|nr:hypothetical protein BGY98DRAFT_948473 [Russula aff. rugulosa BPL654]